MSSSVVAERRMLGRKNMSKGVKWWSVKKKRRVDMY
jgi:hypothetical protein